MALWTCDCLAQVDEMLSFSLGLQNSSPQGDFGDLWLLGIVLRSRQPSCVRLTALTMILNSFHAQALRAYSGVLSQLCRNCRAKASAEG